MKVIRHFEDAIIDGSIELYDYRERLICEVKDNKIQFGRKLVDKEGYRFDLEAKFTDCIYINGCYMFFDKKDLVAVINMKKKMFIVLKFKARCHCCGKLFELKDDDLFNVSALYCNKCYDLVCAYDLED